MVPAASVVEPVDADVPAPEVVAELTVDAPFLMATVNWSSESVRDATDLARVKRGRVVLVKVQVITSPGCGVTANEVPDPDGRTVLEPDFEFAQLMLAAYCPMALALPDAIVSVRV